MTFFAEILENFNRKERNLLVRHILGYKSIPTLHWSFCEQLSKVLSPLQVPANAWWATDYHISWLAGALALLATDLSDRRRWSNRGTAYGGRMIERNQEDIDLLLTFDAHLILVEAKGDSKFDEEQLSHKIERIKAIHNFYEEIANPSYKLNFHFVLISPPKWEPAKLHLDWPSWVYKNGNVPWVPLNMADGLLQVGQCDERRKRAKHEDYWRVFP